MFHMAEFLSNCGFLSKTWLSVIPAATPKKLRPTSALQLCPRSAYKLNASSLELCAEVCGPGSRLNNRRYPLPCIRVAAQSALQL